MRTTQSHPKLRPLGVVFRAFAGLVVLGAGVGAYLLLYATAPEPPRTERVEPSRLVRTIPAREAPVARTWPGYGTARAEVASDISAEVEGLVVARPAHVDPGAVVEAGTLLFQIEPDEYEDRVARIESRIESLQARLDALDVEESSLIASLELAEEASALIQWELDRLREAEARGAAQAAEINRLERQRTIVNREEQTLRQQRELIPTRRRELIASLGVEQSDLRMAKLELEKTTIRAPFSGSLQRVDAQVGERVAPGQVMARLIDLRRIEIPIRAPLTAIASIRVGDLIEVRTDGAQRRTWTATIARIAPEADAASRTITVFAEVEQNPDSDRRELLAPGQFVACELRAAETTELILVPRGAVTGDSVLVVNQRGRAEARRVDVAFHLSGDFRGIDPLETQWAAIGEGLAPGDEVIISNLDELKPGTLVQSRTDEPEGASP